MPHFDFFKLMNHRVALSHLQELYTARESHTSGVLIIHTIKKDSNCIAKCDTLKYRYM